MVDANTIASYPMTKVRAWAYPITLGFIDIKNRERLDHIALSWELCTEVVTWDETDLVSCDILPVVNYTA